MSVRKVQLAFDGAVVAEVPETPLDALPAILTRAQSACRLMADLSRDQRASILLKASQHFLDKKEDLARTITLESGKPIREARIEVERAASTLRFSAQAALSLAGEEVPMDAAAQGSGRLAYTLHQPLGVIAAITPFNFPLNLSMHKVGPAIAAGNAILHKPASATPLSALHAASILALSGLPPDALQVLVGPGAELGDALVSSPTVRMITFTGSSAVGVTLQAKAGIKRLTLELGSNSAVLILDDADLDLALPACVTGAFTNSGQSCISIQRIYVAAPLFDQFTERFVQATKKLIIAHPLQEDSDISSLITEQDAQRVQSWIGEAVREGASLLTGGGRNLATLQPTVLASVNTSSRLHLDEAFGPVVGITPFHSLDQAIQLANDSRYGLQAGVFTSNLKAAWRCAKEIETGSVLINDASNFRVDQMPYGGLKDSGLGKEGPHYAIQQMSQTKLLSWNLS